MYFKQVQTNNVINTWQDINNSDKFPTPVEATEMIKEQKVAFALKQKEFAVSLLDNLRREKLDILIKDNFL